MAGRPFAIGAGNMDGFEMILRVVDGITKCEGIGQVLFDGRFPDTTEHGQPAIQIIYGFLIIHLPAKLQKKAGLWARLYADFY